MPFAVRFFAILLRIKVVYLIKLSINMQYYLVVNVYALYRLSILSYYIAYNNNNLIVIGIIIYNIVDVLIKHPYYIEVYYP